MTSQLQFFDEGPRLPEGFVYRPDVITPEHEAEVLAHMSELPFREFEFHGYTGKRRIVSYGWRYDYEERELERSAPVPDFLVKLRDVAAAFAGLPATDLQHVLVTEYGPGAAIGWHRDKDVFEEVIGLSLLSSCQFRLRRRAGTTWERATITAERRSAYLMRGPARTVWEHSIPAVDSLRYSVTFRNLRNR